MTNTTIDLETLELDVELAATPMEITSLMAARNAENNVEAQRILNRAISGRVSRLRAKSVDLTGQVARLEHALDRERAESAKWKAHSRKWEDRVKDRNDHVTDWHQLYNDLLTKISNKLDQKDN